MFTGSSMNEIIKKKKRSSKSAHQFMNQIYCENPILMAILAVILNLKKCSIVNSINQLVSDSVACYAPESNEKKNQLAKS